MRLWHSIRSDGGDVWPVSVPALGHKSRFKGNVIEGADGQPRPCHHCQQHKPGVVPLEPGSKWYQGAIVGIVSVVVSIVCKVSLVLTLWSYRRNVNRCHTPNALCVDLKTNQILRARPAMRMITGLPSNGQVTQGWTFEEASQPASVDPMLQRHMDALELRMSDNSVLVMDLERSQRRQQPGDNPT